MQINCPTCAASYDVPDGAIGPSGRKVRCRACGTSWHEAPPAPAAVAPPGAMPAAAALPVEQPAVPEVAATAPAAAAMVDPAEPVMPDPIAVETEIVARQRRRRGPWLLLVLVVLVAILGVVAASLAFGPREVAAKFGLTDARVPLGIAISREPDWRQIADGSQLFAVSGRIWNPTHEPQSVPDIRAELKDAQGRVVYAWTITRPVPTLAPGASIDFDGAAVDVPPTSNKVEVSFVGAS